MKTEQRREKEKEREKRGKKEKRPVVACRGCWRATEETAILHKMREERERKRGREIRGREEKAVEMPLGGYHGSWTAQNSLWLHLPTSLCITFFKKYNKIRTLPLFQTHNGRRLF